MKIEFTLDRHTPARVRDAIGTYIVWIGFMVMTKRVRDRWHRVMKTGDPEERVTLH